MTSANELVAIEKTSVVAAYTAEGGLDPWVDKARGIVTDFKHDMATATSRKRTASLARRVASTKVQVDDFGKELVADWKASAKTVDAVRKKFRDEMDELKVTARKPLTDWEAKESARVDAHRAKIAEIDGLGYDAGRVNLAGLRESLAKISAFVIDGTFEEFKGEATEAKLTAVAALNEAIKGEEVRIKQEQEFTRLRAIEEQQKQAERDAAIKQGAVEEATRKAQRDAQAELDRAELERQAAVVKQIEAEVALIENKNVLETEAREIAARKSDCDHVEEVRGKVRAALVQFAGLDDVAARKVVFAISNNVIPNVKIEY